MCSAFTRAHRLIRIDDGEGGEQNPEDEAERDGGGHGAAHGVGPAGMRAAERDGERDGAREPEDGRESLERQRYEAVERAGIVEGGDPDVREDKQRPDRVEKHKVDLARGAGKGAIEGVHDCENRRVSGRASGSRECTWDLTVGCQAELDYGEGRRHDVGDANEPYNHIGGERLRSTYGWE